MSAASPSRRGSSPDRSASDTLLGNYDNPWFTQSGATGIAEDRLADVGPPAALLRAAVQLRRPERPEAVAPPRLRCVLGESVRGGTSSPIFTPEGTHHEQFDQFGMFHGSADGQLDPPAIPVRPLPTLTRSPTRVEHRAGGLNTWLIEEVEWSGRAATRTRAPHRPRR